MAAQKKSDRKEAKRRKIRSNVLSGLAEGLSVTEVCACNQIARSTYYDWIDHDPAFARGVEHTHDARASAIDSVLWHASCRAIGDPRYIRAATAYLRIHEQREKRRNEQKRWEAEHARWQAEHVRWQAEHARWEAEQRQREVEEQHREPEEQSTETSRPEKSTSKRTKAAHRPLRTKPRRVRVIRRRYTPPLPPKWVRRHLPELTSAALAAQSIPAHLTATPITGDGTSLPEPIPIPQPAV